MARSGFWKPRRQRAVLVTGASGYLGRRLTRHPAADAWEIVAPPSSILDVRRQDAVVDAIAQWKPRAVVHLACRADDPRVIVDGSRHVAEATAAAGIRLVHLSTDLVFGGRPDPYREDDTPDPCLPYGRWKADAEAAVLVAHEGALVLRTSMLYGTDQLSPHQREIEQAARGHRSMSFFTDEVRCPTHVDDLAGAVCDLAGRPEVTGVLHVAAPEAVDRATFAAHHARWAGLDPSRLHTTTLADAGVERPGRVVLDSSRAAALGCSLRPVSAVLTR